MRVLAVAVMAAGLVGVTGCGGGGYTTVSGVVLLDGEPLPEASVAFVPEDPSGENATGYTDDRGRFTMTSMSKDGVRPGKYKVRIEALAEKPPPVKGMAQVMAEKFEGAGGKGSATAGAAAYQAQTQNSQLKRLKRASPPIYNDPNKTPLRADVPAQTDYKFELTKDGK